METILSPKSICNNCTGGNKNSLAWGGHGLISYGCQNIVNVVHCQSVKLVQSLESHSAIVVKTAWKPPSLSYSSTDRPSLWLASGDLSGQVIIWDVVKGAVLATFHDAKKSVKDLHWMSPTLLHDVILVVHTNVISAWSLKEKNCTPLWTQPFNDVLQFISPHQLLTSHLAVIGTSSIFVYFHFDCEIEQKDSGSQYLVYSKKGDVLKPKYFIPQKDERAQLSEVEQCSLKDCIQFSFHPFYRDHAILVFPRDIFIFDLEIGVCITNISLEKHASTFYQSFFCTFTNEFIAVHDSGQLSFRQLAQNEANFAALTPTDQDTPQTIKSLTIKNYTPIRYSLSAQTDALRLPRQAKPLAAALEPIGERQVAVLMSSGRLFLWRLQQKISGSNLGFALSGLYSGHSGGICSMRIVPGFASGDLTGYRPLVAVGCQTGNVQIVNLSSGMLENDFAVSPLPVTAIDWASSKRVVCAGVIGGPSLVTQASDSGNLTSTIKNELFVISLPSGKVCQLKSTRNDGTPIASITCSPSGYLAVVIYGSGAVDIWDLETHHVVRSLQIQAASAQWARRRVNRSISDQTDDPRMSPTHSISDQTLAPPHPNSTVSAAAHYDELIIVSVSGRLLRFVFTGKSAQEKTLNFDMHVNSAVTAMAWKGRYIVASEIDGKIIVENIIDKRYTTFSTNKTSGNSVRRLVFSPGRRNYSFLALYSDGSCDLCSAESGEITNSLRVRSDAASTGGLAARAIDADFWAPGIPVLAMTSGAIRILNFDFQFDNCPISARIRKPEILSPYLVADGGRQLTSHRLLAQHNEKNETDCNHGEWPAPWLVPYWPYLEQTGDRAERCAMVARVLGCDAEYRFWTVVKYYLDVYQGKPSQSLPLSMGLVCCDEDFKAFAMNNLRRQISIAELTQQRRRLADILGAYGDQESAASALLATLPTDPHFIQDWLKACLIDASSANNTRTATLKLVATNLLADGHIFDGIHLLCLVGLQYDACRYLQSSGFWLDAVKLAKCTLVQVQQRNDVIKKFVNSVVQSSSAISQTTSQRLFAVLLLISISQFRSAVELLLQYRWTDLAGRLAECLVERLGPSAFVNMPSSGQSTPEPTEKKHHENEIEGKESNRIQDPILEVATAALARLLADHRLGKQASICASRCSPERHSALLREIELLCNDSSSST